MMVLSDCIAAYCHLSLIFGWVGTDSYDQADASSGRERKLKFSSEIPTSWKFKKSDLFVSSKSANIRSGLGTSSDEKRLRI